MCVELVNRVEIECEQSAVHRRKQVLGRGSALASTDQLGLSASHREPPHEGGISLVRAGGGSHPLESVRQFGIGCHGDSRMLAGHSLKCSSAE